jgi:hypothetical protein
MFILGPLAQLAEQLTLNQPVVSSSLTRLTKITRNLRSPSFFMSTTMQFRHCRILRISTDYGKILIVFVKFLSIRKPDFTGVRGRLYE